MSRDFDAALTAVTGMRQRQQSRPAERSTSRATITSVVPLRLDLHGTDLDLDQEDVELDDTVAQYKTAKGLKTGDVLVVHEVDEGDWIATAVIPG